MLSFEWDLIKNLKNIKKHGVAFEEAKEVFNDENGIIINDDEHSDEEERFVLMGMTSNAKLLIVVHCYRSAESVIRIISARKANKTETKQYFERG